MAAIVARDTGKASAGSGVANDVDPLRREILLRRGKSVGRGVGMGFGIEHICEPAAMEIS
jgi:hypothetical protein